MSSSTSSSTSTFTLSSYKDIFGAPKTGVHRHRIAGIAVVDVAATILAAGIIHYFVPRWHIVYILLTLFAAGIVLHRAFSVRTTVDKWLFPRV